MRAILFLILIQISVNNILSTDVRHSCNAASGFANVASIGDSRADALGALAELTRDFIQTAEQNGLPVLLPGQIVMQDLGQYGATTTDWVKKNQSCLALGFGNYFNVPPKVVMSLGGNSVSVYIRDKYFFYSWSRMKRTSKDMDLS